MLLDEFIDYLETIHKMDQLPLNLEQLNQLSLFVRKLEIEALSYRNNPQTQEVGNALHYLLTTPLSTPRPEPYSLLEALKESETFNDTLNSHSFFYKLWIDLFAYWKNHGTHPFVIELKAFQKKL